MLFEVTTHLVPIVEGWTAWMSKGSERVGGLLHGHLGLNKVSGLNGNNFHCVRNASIGWPISYIKLYLLTFVIA